MRVHVLTSRPKGVRIIVIWSGSIASIPDGWRLCDGSNGTPDLRDRFVRGTATTPGVTGGSNSGPQAHQHNNASTALAGPEAAHHHDGTFQTGFTDIWQGHNLTEDGAAGAQHTHTVIPDWLNSLILDEHPAGGVAGVDGAVEDHRPPYYALAYIQGRASPPANSIVMMSGSLADVPAGWRLCNGLNGTPNMAESFVVGAGGSYAVGAIVGSNTAVTSHTHAASGLYSQGETGGGHTHTLAVNTNYGGPSMTVSINAGGGVPGYPNGVHRHVGPAQAQTSGPASFHKHQFRSSLGVSSPQDQSPAYYKLFFVKVA